MSRITGLAHVQPETELTLKTTENCLFLWNTGPEPGPRLKVIS